MTTETKQDARPSKKPPAASFASEVWKTLSAINCNDHVELKGRLSYLSWAWAMKMLFDHFPESNFEELEPRHFSDGTVQVRTRVHVRRGEDAVVREMWLPVMDHKNQAVQNPDARKLSDATMRCLVKNIAVCGLGLYIYAGEDLPEEPAPAPAPKGPNGRPYLTPEQWQLNLGKAKDRIQSGAVLAKNIIDIIESKYSLTHQQKAAIQSIKPLAVEEEEDVTA